MAEEGEGEEEEERATEREEGPSADLPIDALYLVALHLPPPDLLNFRRVCKLWRRSIIPFESHPLSRSPLLLSSRPSNGGDKLRLCSPLHRRRFTLAVSREVSDIFKSPASHTVYSRFGWLVFFKYDEPQHPAIVFVNPFLPPGSAAAAVIKWRMPESCCDSATTVSMSAPPTDPNCVFLLTNTCLMHRIEMIVGGKGGVDWRFDSFRSRCSEEFVACLTNPVFRDGMFYYLGRFTGMWVTLGIYNPHRRTWACHHLGVTLYSTCKCILMESEGELLAAFGPRTDKILPESVPSVGPVVYRVNELSMKLEELTDLRGRSLFMDERSAFLAATEVEGMNDRIYCTSSCVDTDEDVDYKSHCYSLDRGSLTERSRRFFYFGHAGYDDAEDEEVEREDEREEWWEEEDDDDDSNWMPLGIWVQPNWEWMNG